MMAIFNKFSKEALIVVISMMLGLLSTLWALYGKSQENAESIKLRRLESVELDIRMIRLEFLAMYKANIDFYVWFAKKEGYPNIARDFAEKLKDVR